VSRSGRLLLAAALAATLTITGANIDKDDAWVASRRNFWAFQKPVRPEPPAVADAWVRSPIDAFLLAAMREKGLSPSRPASRAKLIRRVTLDLTGLPPTPGEVDLFVRDSSADAYEKLVDRLMVSKAYGERWALRWLDVARYADTNGFEADGLRKDAWRYRDYVVRAIEAGKPFDRFVREQIAGDELFPGDTDALIATGFLRAGPRHVVGGMQDEEMNRQEVLTEMTQAIGSVFLGLTVHCARCHNHKFDPVPQADYYRLQAVFAATDLKDQPIASEAAKKVYEAELAAYKARLKPAQDQIAAIEKPYRDRLRAEKMAQLEPQFRQVLDVPKDKRDEAQKRLAKEAEGQLKIYWDEVVALLTPAERERRAGLRRQLHEIEYTEPEPPAAAFGVTNMDTAPATHILKVGDYRHKLGEVTPGFPRVVTGIDAASPEGPARRRAALADWLTSPDHPLVARVMVNRIWQFRMGTGLVKTPNDFGTLGARPSNPKLLDWLAAEFVSRGWSVKTIDRMIVLSSAYRQDTADDAAKSKIDAENKYYWRMNRRRLEGEAIRDQMLAVSGMLNPRAGGRPIRIPIEPEVYDQIFTEGEPDNLWPVDRDPSQHNRRSIYLLNKRQVRLPFLTNFDQPDAMSSCAMRPVSTHALQALSLMNSDFAQQQAQALAARLERECGGDGDCRVRRAYKLTLGRAPAAAESSMAREFFSGRGKLEDFTLALLNRNEFVYIP
jgi:hypothetical protein